MTVDLRPRQRRRRRPPGGPRLRCAPPGRSESGRCPGTRRAGDADTARAAAPARRLRGGVAQERAGQHEEVVELELPCRLPLARRREGEAADGASDPLGARARRPARGHPPPASPRVSTRPLRTSSTSSHASCLPDLRDLEARQRRVRARAERLQEGELVLHCRDSASMPLGDDPRYAAGACRTDRCTARRAGRGRRRRRGPGGRCDRRRVRCTAGPAPRRGPSCPRTPAPGSAAPRGVHRPRRTGAGCAPSPGRTSSSSWNIAQRCSKATSELTSSSTSIRGGRPASIGFSDRIRRAKECRVPMAAPSS